MGTDKQTLQALLAERNLLDAVLNYVGALVLVLDREGRIRRFNRACERLAGYSFAEVEGKCPWDIVLPVEEAKSVREQAFEALKKDPGSLVGEYTNYWVSKNGQRYLIRWNNTTLRNENGDVEYVVALGTDITDSHAIEQALRGNEARLNEVQRMAHIGGWELDLASNILYWTDEIFNMFEIDKSRFGASYEAFLNAIHPEDRDAVNNAYTNSLKTRTAYEIAHRLLMPDGRIKWVNERCESFFDSEGKPIRSIGTVQDITDQVRFEQELQELNHSLERRVSDRTYELASERNFISTVLDTANALVVVLNCDGKVVRFNRACESLTGYSQKDMLGQVPWEVLVPEEQRGLVKQTFDNILQHASTANYELEWLTRSGERRIIDWSNSIIKNSKGDIEYIIETGVDITERKAAELALIQARDKAEQASRAKSEFLSRMSHELRTPLNAILGFSQLLESDKTNALNPVQQENVLEIIHAGNHLLELINEILDLSRIEAGRMQLILEPVAVERVIRDCVSLVQSLAEQHRITLVRDSIPPTDINVMADPVRLKQVVLNLLSNAIKYNNKDGSVHVQIKQTGNEICIAVRDTGDGLSESQQQKLFEPFERLDADLKAIQGTGIGLALSKRLMEMMNGTIGVESHKGVGSTFSITLPVNKE